MKKILLITHNYLPSVGGIETISKLLADYLPREKFEVIILTNQPKTKDSSFNYEVIYRPPLWKKIKYILWSDVILENNPCFSLSWPNFILNRSKITILQTWIDTKGFKNQFKRLLLKKSIHLISISTQIKESFSDNSIIIHNPYDENVFKSYNHIKKEKDLVFLGRLVCDKGVDILLIAFSKFIKENSIFKNSKLTIIGDGEEKENLIAHSQILRIEKNVTFTGVLKGADLVNELNKHKILVVPSKWNEPFGIVALEGMACGCIPIVSGNSGLVEAVGNAGITFNKNDELDLYNKIVELLSNEELQNNLLEKAKIHLIDFTIKSYIDKLVSLIENT